MGTRQSNSADPMGSMGVLLSRLPALHAASTASHLTFSFVPKCVISVAANVLMPFPLVCSQSWHTLSTASDVKKLFDGC